MRLRAFPNVGRDRMGIGMGPPYRARKMRVRLGRERIVPVKVLPHICDFAMRRMTPIDAGLPSGEAPNYRSDPKRCPISRHESRHSPALGSACESRQARPAPGSPHAGEAMRAFSGGDGPSFEDDRGPGQAELWRRFPARPIHDDGKAGSSRNILKNGREEGLE